MADYTEERPWGSFTTHDTNVKMKTIRVKQNQRLSLQRHQHRDEYWLVEAGGGWAVVGGKKYWLRSNPDPSEGWETNRLYIPAGTVHRLEAGFKGITLIEFQVGEILEESDIERLEDDYDRAGSTTEDS